MSGVAVFGVPMQRRALPTVFRDLDPYVESLELSRFVLAEPVQPHQQPGACANELRTDVGA